MRLYLIRHGDAEDGVADASRSLSDRGKDEIRLTAEFLKKNGVKVDCIYHSGLLRAKQSAEIIARTLGRPPLVVKDYLSPNSPVGPFMSELIKLKKDVAVAGHMPYLGYLVAKLLTGVDRAGLVEFKKAGCLFLEKEKDEPWKMRWFTVPSILTNLEGA